MYQGMLGLVIYSQSIVSASLINMLPRITIGSQIRVGFDLIAPRHHNEVVNTWLMKIVSLM